MVSWLKIWHLPCQCLAWPGPLLSPSLPLPSLPLHSCLPSFPPTFGLSCSSSSTLTDLSDRHFQGFIPLPSPLLHRRLPPDSVCCACTLNNQHLHHLLHSTRPKQAQRERQRERERERELRLGWGFRGR